MLQKINFLLAIILIFILPGKIAAQEVVSYSISDGVAHKHVNWFCQDSDGYLWISTWGGLSRFDGHSFTSYNNNPDDTSTISNDLVNNIALDSAGQIWVVTHGGVVKYLNRTNNFQRIYFRGKNSLTNIRPMDLCFDKNNQGWLVDSEGLVSFDTDLHSIRYVDISDFHHEYSQIIPDSSGLWIASGKGLLHFPFHILANSTKISIRDADTYFPFEDKNHQIHVNDFSMTESGKFILVTGSMENPYSPIFISDEKTHSLQQIPFPTSTDGALFFQLTGAINEITPDRMLLSTDYQKTVVLNLKTRAFEFDDPIKNIIGNKSPTIFYSDNQSNIWFGGISGLFKFTKPQLNFNYWTFEPGKMNSISGYELTAALFKDKNNHLWIGSKDGGLDRIDLRDNSVLNIKLPPELSNLSNPKAVYNMIALNDNELLINIDTALFRYNIPKNRFSFFKSVDFHVYKFFKDSRENIWMTDRNNIMIGKPDDDYKTFRSIKLTDFLPIPRSTRDIFEDSKGQIWLACGEGLVKFDIEYPKASKIFVAPGSEIDPEFFCIHETKKRTFWLGTIRNGIYAFDPGTEKFTAHYSSNEALIDNSVNVIFEDKAGKLWMSTWKGIAVLDPETGKIDNYSTVNGLPFPEFNTGSHFRDEDGTIYFGGQGGVVAFHPDSLVNFTHETPLLIHSVTGENGLMTLDYPLKGGETIEIPHTQSLIEISFGALDFRHPHQRIYRYRLSGFQENWTQIKTGELIARYAALTAGLYVFEVQSTYEGWPWNGKPVKIFINVEPPPFYQRRIFLLILTFAFFVAVVMVIFLRMRNKNMRKEMEIAFLEKQANQSTLNFLKSQMNPHFYFNTLNAINSYIMQNEMRMANKYLTTFAKLMREILDNSQKEFVTVAEEKEVLQKYLTLQRLRFPNVFDYAIEAGDDVLQKRIPPMLMQPFVENSVEYAFGGMTNKGMIKVRFEKENNQLIATISDNGIGTENSMKLKTLSNRKSTAIKNIHSRVVVLNKMYSTNIQISILPYKPENNEFPGTIVTITFPDFVNQEDKTENSKIK